MTFFFGPPSPTSNLTVAAEQEITTLLNGRKFLIENHAKSRKFREFTRNRGQFQSPITIAPRRLRLSGPKAMYCWPYFWGLKIWPRFWLRSPEPPSLKSPLVLTSWVFGGSGLPHNVEDEISGLFRNFLSFFKTFVWEFQFFKTIQGLINAGRSAASKFGRHVFCAIIFHLNVKFGGSGVKNGHFRATICTNFELSNPYLFRKTALANADLSPT